MPSIIEPIPGRLYTAFPDCIDYLHDELEFRDYAPRAPSAVRYGETIYIPTANKNDVVPFWCKCAYLEPLKISFESISEASHALRSLQRNWASNQYSRYRRASLIQEKLPYINVKEKPFPFHIPRSSMGIWMLTDEHTILASPHTSSPLPAGHIAFIEDHQNPPSRAYLKLQEALALFEHYFGRFPQAGERCFDAGACPGGWSWVLSGLGCKVFAVDRAQLEPRLMEHPNITFAAHDAFTLLPQEIGPFDWVFSDVICYPERLYDWIGRWIKSGACANMICTIKMQGKADWKLLDQFAAIDGSRVVHLNYNKHELTWLYCANKSAQDLKPFAGENMYEY